MLESLTKAYQTDPIGVAQNAMKLTAYIQRAEEVSGDTAAAGERSPDLDGIGRAAELLLGNVDWQNGGIGDAPKFPNAMVFTFLWRYGTLKNHESSKQAVLLTLKKMASGGIYDHLGGGFSRYSVDATWSVPHFEKMLYDNGLLLRLYSEVLLSRDPIITSSDRSGCGPRHRSCLLREMRGPEGGFFAAQDADSEGEEGVFFAWDPVDLAQVLSEERDRKIFRFDSVWKREAISSTVRRCSSSPKPKKKSRRLSGLRSKTCRRACRSPFRGCLRRAREESLRGPTTKFSHLGTGLPSAD